MEKGTYRVCLLLFALSAVSCVAVNVSESEDVLSDDFSREIFSLLPILPTFTDKIRNERCRNDSRVFREQLANFRLWAVKMLDASTKMPDGILEGNTFQLGHFDECLSVNVQLPDDNRRLRGQYCLAEIEYSPKNMEDVRKDSSDYIDLFNTSAWLHISSYSLDRTKTRRDEIFWSLCVPESCGPQDVKEAMDEAFRESSSSFNVDVVVKVNEKFCQVGKEPFDFSWIGLSQLALGFGLGMVCSGRSRSSLGLPTIRDASTAPASGTTSFMPFGTAPKAPSSADDSGLVLPVNRPGLSVIRIGSSSSRAPHVFFSCPVYAPVVTSTVGVVGLFGALVFTSTLYDMMALKEEKRIIKGALAKFLKCFSAKVNFKNLRTVDASKDIIPIHTARFMSMIVILMGHRFIANSGAPIHNAVFMENAVGNPLFIHLLMGPILVVDTFFLLSGFLTGYQMLRDFDARRFKLISGYVHRYIRLTPVYMLVVFFYATFLYHLGSGPLWKARVSLEEQRCADNWWTNLAYINNYVNTESLCMFQSWHLTCDFHFYLMAPPIVYLLWKKAVLGFTLIGFLILGVMGLLFALTFLNNLDPVLMSFNSVMVDLSSDPTFRVTYIPTHTRFIPYLIGIIASYIYYKKKLHIKLSSKQKIGSAAAAFIIGHIPILTAIIFYSPGYEYDKLQASLYAALHRLPWCAAIAWLILSAGTGNAGILQSAISWKAFVPLSRLTYCVFLSHGAIQLYTSSSLRTPEYNSKFKVLWTLMGDVLVTYIVALVMHILFEAPILKLDRTYLTSSNKPNEENNNDKNKPEINGEVNHGYSTESIQNLPVISNDQIIYSISDKPHEKYSERYEKYLKRESECSKDGTSFEIR